MKDCFHHKGAASLAQPLRKKADGRLFDARNLRFSLALSMIFQYAASSRKAKTSGMSTKCIFAFDSPPFDL